MRTNMQTAKVEQTLLMRRFCGLRSRWRTLWLWQNSRPLNSWYMNDYTRPPQHSVTELKISQQPVHERPPQHLPITISQRNIQRLARKSGYKNSFILYVLSNSSVTCRCDTSVCILRALTGWPLFLNSDFSMTFPWPKKWISMTYRHSIFFRNKRYTIYECLPEWKYISSCSSISQ